MKRESERRVWVEDCAKRIRVAFNGETIVDSLSAKLLFEAGHPPTFYVPKTDVRMERLTLSAHLTVCPFKGDASYWSVSVGAERQENAAWCYETPKPDCAAIAGHLAFYWNKMQGWWEEDQPLLGHARDPYVRIDTLPSSRRVTVIAGGETVADSRRAVFLFETGHPPRFYLPPEDVRMHLLRPSAKRSFCPYKGEASYFDATVGATSVEAIAWSYAEPWSEVAAIRGRIAFYPERVDRIDVAPR